MDIRLLRVYVCVSLYAYTNMYVYLHAQAYAYAPGTCGLCVRFRVVAGEARRFWTCSTISRLVCQGSCYQGGWPTL